MFHFMSSKYYYSLRLHMILRAKSGPNISMLFLIARVVVFLVLIYLSVIPLFGVLSVIPIFGVYCLDMSSYDL